MACSRAERSSEEIAIIGNEVIVGISPLMGGDITPSRAINQNAGEAYRLQGEFLKDEFKRSEELQQLLVRYTQALITQMAQTAVCNPHHSLDQRPCRWLLLRLDRKRLEAHACECYNVVKKEFDRLLPHVVESTDR